MGGERGVVGDISVTARHEVHLTYFSLQWNLICDRSHLKAMTQAVYMAGLLVGSIVFSAISDHFGRKFGVFLSIACTVSN